MKTKVMFRVEEDGQILAVFPECLATPAYSDLTLVCYAHIGQHSSCAVSYVLDNTKPATKAQYNDLLNELVLNVGYERLQVVRSTKSLEDRMKACS